MLAEHETLGTPFDSTSQKGPVWKKYIEDTCHPNDAGHAIYANTITSYISEQLGTGVAHTNPVTTVDLAQKTSFAETQGIDPAHLKENGRRISFKDAGFTKRQLPGWTLTTTNNESDKGNSNGVISSTVNGANFAFEFTGTAVGFYNQGHPDSGSLQYTITSKDDPTESYSGKVSLIKNYSSGLPYPAELKTGLENKTWIVNCTLVPNPGGKKGELKYIYINGEPESVVPLEANRDIVNLPAISKTVQASSAVYGATGTKVDNFEGLPAYKYTQKTEENIEIQLDYWSFGSLVPKVFFDDYKVVSLTYYYEPNGSDKVTKTTMGFDQYQYFNDQNEKIGSGYVSDKADFKDHARVSRDIVSGKWITQYFDMSGFADKAQELHPGSWLYCGRICPFGRVNSKNLAKTEVYYLNNISFHSSVPLLYNETGAKIDYNDGSAIAYVSSTGSVTIGDKTFAAYTDIDQAVTALGMFGGTIRISGEHIFTDGNIARGKLTIESADETGKLINDKLTITKGDLELKNIKYKGHNDEMWTTTNGFKLTIGENVTMDYPIRPGSAGPKPTNVDFYSGKTKSFAAMAGYENSGTATGTSVFNFYGGSHPEIAGISRNGHPTGASVQTFNGDIFYNIYGGTYGTSSSTYYYASATSRAKLNGKLWYTINGGVFRNAKLVFGNLQNSSVQNLVLDAQMFIINNKQIVENGGSFTTSSIGEKRNQGITNSDAILMVIINNDELSEQTGASITAEEYANYKIKVSGGSAMPVFDESNALLGFDITSDTGAEVGVMLDGVLLQKNSNGYYTIEPSVTAVRSISFDDELSITLSDGNGNTTELTAKKNSTYTLPAKTTFTAPSGKLFAGWKVDNDETIYCPGESFTLGDTSTTVTAQWIDKSAVENVYISQSGGNDDNVGIIKRQPLKTIEKAVELVGSGESFTIVLLDVYSLDAQYAKLPTHTGMLTITAEDDGALRYNQNLDAKGPLTIKDIALGRYHESQGFVDNSGYPLIFRGNVPVLEGHKTNRYHIGRNNNDAPYQTVEIDSGEYNLLYMGAYYIKDNTTKNSDGGKITINGGNVTYIRFYNDGYGSYKGKTVYTNALSLVINGGTVGSLTFNGNGATYNYPFQLILNNNSNAPTLSYTNVIKIISYDGGSVDATTTPGVFKIITDSPTIYINGVETAKTADNLYTINTVGTHIVSYNKHTVSYAASSSDLQGDAPAPTHHIQGIESMLAQNTFIRPGFAFAGWSDGEKLVTADSITQDTVLYPVWSSNVDNAEYLNASGYIDSDGDGKVDIVAKKTFTEAINRITNAKGGTIYFDGDIKVSTIKETTNATRGPVLVRGIKNDSSAGIIFDRHLDFSKNDITFDYLTTKGATYETFCQIFNGHKLTFGEHVATIQNGGRGIYIGVQSGGTGDAIFELNSGIYSMVMSHGCWESTKTFNGNVYTTFNGGEFSSIHGASRDGNADTRATLNGNVYYTFNGGRFTTDIYTGSKKQGAILGNVIFEINGGLFKTKENKLVKIETGHESPTATPESHGASGKNLAIIVNNKNFKPDTAKSIAEIGRADVNATALLGKAIFIINNSEIDNGFGFNSNSTAEYKIRVANGNAQPVFASGVGGDLLGFEISSDVEGLIPAINNVPITKNELGYYEIAENAGKQAYIDISFIPEIGFVTVGDEVVSAEEDTLTVTKDGQANFVKSNAPKRANGLFLGWFKNDLAVANGQALSAGDVLTAKYETFDTDYQSPTANFAVMGAQIRLSGESRALRFVNKFGKSLRSKLLEITTGFAPASYDDKDVGYGFVVLPTNMLDGQKLTKQTPMAAIVPAVRTYSEKTNEIEYTVCITDITDYNREYTAIPYATYTDAQGIEHTVYGESYSASMKTIANAALSSGESFSDADRAVLEEIAQ